MNNLTLHSARMRMHKTDGCWPLASLARITVEIEMDVGSFFAAHYHRPESDDVGDCEIYQLVSESPASTLRIFLRKSGEMYWEETQISLSSPWVFIPPGWQHGGLLVGEHPIVFHAHTRASHTRPGEEDGNVIWLPDDEQPRDIRSAMESFRRKEV